MIRFRTGSKLELTLYVQLGDEPDHRPPEEGGDLVIGFLDPGWGSAIADVLNEHVGSYGGLILAFVDPKAAAAVTEAVNRRRDEEAEGAG